MEKQRDKSGRFVKGHGGFKPVGATSRKKRKQNHPIDEILLFLMDQMEATVPLLTPTERVRLWKDLMAYTVPKLKRISHEQIKESQVKEHPKVVFEIVKDGKVISST